MINFNLKDTKFRKALNDIFFAVFSGIIISFAYYIFQNSNTFAPGGVGGLATITYYLLNYKVSWAILMVLFNIPIFILVSIFVNKKLGLYLILYMCVQSFGTDLWKIIGILPYCKINNGEDFQIVFACIAVGIISGFGFALMLRHFGTSGGTYAISALIKRFNPSINIAYTSFWMDSSVVCLAFFVYGMKITPVICTLLNLFIANVVVDYSLSGIKNGYKFEIITDTPDSLIKELIEELHHGVTEIKVLGTYSNTNKYMLVCIITKKQIGQMIKILNKFPKTFSSFSKVNEVFGRFKK